MSKTFVLDMYFNRDSNATHRIPVAKRKEDIAALFAVRTFPLYGTFGNSLNKRTVDNFNLSEDSVDFIVKSLDLENEKATIEWINGRFIPESFDKIDLCLAYYINDKDVTNLRYGFMQPKDDFKYKAYEIKPTEKEDELFDFAVALRLLMDNKPVMRLKWGYYSTSFISLSPGTPNLPQERFWSPCNAAAVGLTTSKTANVAPQFTKFTGTDVEQYIVTPEDLIAKDWCLNDTVMKAFNGIPNETTMNGPEVTDIHKEEVLVEK